MQLDSETTRRVLERVEQRKNDTVEFLQDLVVAAKERAKTILEKHTPGPLEKTTAEEFDKILKAASRELG